MKAEDISEEAMHGSQKESWEESFKRGDNYLFYPNEEVIRFVSKHIRKRTGLFDFIDRKSFVSAPNVLDFGCGIGRHLKYCYEMGLDVYGIDISEFAVITARNWLSSAGMANVDTRILHGDASTLPWDSGFFMFAVSHGVLDSMPWDKARSACLELARVITPSGLFYCDLISGDDSRHSREYSGQEIVTTKHEENTVQLYFNMQLINDLVAGAFEIEECRLVRSENVLVGGYHSRYHLVLRRI